MTNNERGRKSPFSDTKRTQFILLVSIYLLMAAYAFSNTMLGPLMGKMINDYRLDLSQGALPVTFQSIGGLLAIIFGGILADIYKKPNIIILGFLLYSFGLLAVGSAPAYPLLLMSFFVIGISRMVDTVLNAYISDLFPEKRSKYLSLLHTFFGIGAFSGPLFVRVITDVDGTWNRPYRFLAFGCLALLLFFILCIPKSTTQMRHEVKQVTDKSSFKEILTSKYIWLLCLIMFLYSGHQNGVSVWLPMYMETGLNASPALSSTGLSIFWLGIIAGRLGASFLPENFQGKKLIGIGSFIGGILLGMGIILKNPILLIVFSGFAGFLTGAIIPMIVAMACDRHSKNSGTASSMIFISGTLASMLFPPSIGKIAEAFSFQIAMSLTFIPLILILFVTLFLADS
ncbi:MAG TPA: hypothetical protein DDZ89_06650 [Clostridiales bacterium]|nr:hypothetical protein [Clostridiales bacterium]